MDKTHTSRWAPQFLLVAGAVRNPGQRCEVMRNVQWQQGLKSVYRGIVRPIAASLKMDDDNIHEIEIEEGANTSTNTSPRPSCLTPGRQALADSIMKSVTASVSKLRRGDPPTIYIVPQTIRQVKEVAYEPKTVSIGPYHNGKERLQGMEENKLLYLHSFLSRNPKHPLEDYLKEMEELEDEARSCYSEKVGPLMGNEFVRIMVLDACFIVEIFLEFYPRKYKLESCFTPPELLKHNDEDIVLFTAMHEFFFHSNGFKYPIRHTSMMEYLIGYDMLLLENQIPFFVLQRIFIMACPAKVTHLLEKMALHFFDDIVPRNEKIEIKDSYYHLLDLFYSHLLPTPTNSKEEPNHSCNPKIKLKPNPSCNPKIKSVLNKLKNLLPCSNKAPLPITDGKEEHNLLCNPIMKETSLPITEPRMMIPCATDLQLAGVKFKKNEKSNNILNVKFSHGVLEITPFEIDDHSETLFRNLLAFEQCCPDEALNHFTNYLVFMDYLVNTSKDVALLHENGIIDNNLGSDDDVALLFNRLCIGIFHTFKGGYLEDVHDEVQKHYQKKWYRWWASLKRNYFSNPWSVISLIAASILLLLTITQTFFTVFPYYRPRS